MKFLHKFRTMEEFLNSVYFPQTVEKPTVAAIVVGGVTYYYSEPGDNNYHIWVNPENSEDWVDSDGYRNPEVGYMAYVLGDTTQSIEGIISYEDIGESEPEETEKYEQPWIGWVYNTNVVSYNKYNCDFNGWDYVDLGLPSGTLWAVKNLGAPAVGQMGGFYAWGETSTKSDYSWSTYRFGTENNLTKYNESDGLRTLELEDDAAHVIMGGDWHIPTPEQIAELVQYITYTEDLEYKAYVSTINGNELPFYASSENSGEMDGTSISHLTKGWFEFLSNKLSDSSYVNVQHFSDDGEGCGLIDYATLYTGFRYCGFQIRACIDSHPNQIPINPYE